MSSASKKLKKKKKKTIETKNDSSSKTTSTMNNEEKKFYLDQINSLEVRLIKYVKFFIYVEKVENMFKIAQKRFSLLNIVVLTCLTEIFVTCTC